MIYQYINNLGSNFYILLLTILLYISYSINNINYSIKGVIGLLIGMIVIWFFIDKKKNDFNKDTFIINNILEENPLLSILKNNNDIILFYFNCIKYSTFDYSNFKKSIIYFSKFITIYNFIVDSYKLNKKYMSYYYDILIKNSELCLYYFKNLQFTLPIYLIDDFYKNTNKLNFILENHIHFIISLNNKHIKQFGYSNLNKPIYKEALYYNDTY